MPRQRRVANTRINHSNKDAQKENVKSPKSKLEHMEMHYINNRDSKIAIMKISTRCEKIQTGNSVHSKHKSMIKMSTFPKDVKKEQSALTSLTQ